MRRWTALAAAFMLGAAGTGACRADSFRLCDRPGQLTAAQQDQLFRFGALIKTELEKSGERVALIARSGVDLERFAIRYSHAGIALKDNGGDTPWSVRQLYYACDQRKPGIYDQGISGFLISADNPSLGYVSVVLLPDQQAAELARAAQDKRQALLVLGSDYSANAYAFSLRYQNCNQWVAELLASAWGETRDEGLAASPDEPAGEASLHARAKAQVWLRDQHYEPSTIDVGWRVLMWLTPWIPLLHRDDHPQEDIETKRYRISLPASIESFVQARIPGARRIEFCRTERHMVIHRGWDAMAEGCVPGEQDELVSLD